MFSLDSLEMKMYVNGQPSLIERLSRQQRSYKMAQAIFEVLEGRSDLLITA